MDDLIFDLFQNQRIRNVQIDASESRRKATSAVQSADELRLQVERLTLICHSLWELLSESTGATDAQLLAKVREIDLRDGKSDGKIAARANSCASCGRTFGSQHQACIYCGELVRKSPLSR